jgi:predicted alpha/beta superfamily hydrolase
LHRQTLLGNSSTANRLTARRPTVRSLNAQFGGALALGSFRTTAQLDEGWAAHPQVEKRYRTTKRARDRRRIARGLTGPTENAEDRKIAPRVGGSAKFRAFVRDELIPQVEKRYRTTKERAIVGESLAGLFVIETLVVEPELFDTYIAFDPSLWWNDAKLVVEASKRLRTDAAPAKTLFIATSDEPGIVATARQFVEALGPSNPEGIRWRYEPMPEEKHSTIYHPAALRAFRALFAPESR